MKSKDLQTIRYFLNRYKRYCAVLVASSTIVAVLESLNIAMIVPVINSILGISARLPMPGILMRITDYLRHLMPINDEVAGAALVLLMVTLLKGSSKVVNEWVIAYSSGKILYDTKRAMMERLAQREYQYFLDNKQGQVSHYLLNATAKVGTLIFKAAQLVSELFTITAIAMLLFALNIYATLACIAVGVVFSGLIGMIAKNVSYVLGKGKLGSAAEQAVTFNEFFNGIKQITVFNTKDAWLARFDAQSRLFTRLYIKDFVWLAMPSNLIEVFGISALLASLLVLRTRADGGVIGYLPLAGVFAMSLLKILPALGTIGAARMLMVGCLPDAEAVVNILSQGAAEREETGKKEFKIFSSKIEFDSVSFGYDRSREILADSNLSIKKNETTAIVGGTGTGKTTIINLLLGLFTPSKGRILIDGVDLKEYDIKSFRKKVGLVSQDSFIFHSTILDNITFHSDESSFSDVVEASRLAHIHDFVMSLPDGYKTIVGERGTHLSGGQQQRLAIARALVRRPEILILDEATSSLDPKTEEEIRHAIRGLAHKYTIILIAHRSAILQDADNVLLLDKGVIYDKGKEYSRDHTG